MSIKTLALKCVKNSRDNPDTCKCNDSLNDSNDDIKDGYDKGWDDDHLVALLHRQDNQDISNHVTNTPNDSPDSIS